MKIQIISDLHLDFLGYKESIETIENIIKIADKDTILVLAGDICPIEWWPNLITCFMEEDKLIYKNIILIAGNHEYYRKKTMEDTDNDLRKIINNNLPEEFILLDQDNPITQIDDIKIIGSTLWFPEDPMNFIYKGRLNDVKFITNWLQDAHERWKEFQWYLKQELNNESILITHHLPSYNSIHPIYRGSDTNRFFVGNIEDIILNNQPKLAIHGHTHTSNDYYLDNTRVICNPKGYGNENPSYNPHLVVEI